MLCAIRVEDRAKLDASCTNKSDGPFACPKCQEDVIIRKGNIKIHHFSHLPFSTCGYGVGESEAHRRCKRAIYDALSTIGKVSYCELERDLGTVIPDIYAVIDGTSVAIEIQLSNLSVTNPTDKSVGFIAALVQTDAIKLGRVTFAPIGTRRAAYIESARSSAFCNRFPTRRLFVPDTSRRAAHRATCDREIVPDW